LAEAEKLKVPVLQLQHLTVALGRITSEAEIQKEIIVKNGGKKDLIIRALQPNCSCIQANASKTTIKAGEEQKIVIAFNPKGRTGQQNKSITIYSTDPINPVQRVLITGYIPVQ
jgi:LEA14-like dessication related protein